MIQVIQNHLVRFGAMLAACTASMLVATAGLGFLCVALFLAVRDVSTPAIAALASGGAALVVSALIVLMVRAGMRRRGGMAALNEMARTGDAPQALAAELGLLLGSRMTSGIRSHPLRTSALAVVAGFAVGTSPELRKALQEIFR